MVDTYDYMCLHHNYKTFTAGERQWNMSGLLPSTHLATKEEILAHFSSVVQAVVEETGIQLLTLWGCEVVKRERQGDKMEITVQPVEDVARVLDIPEVTVVADRMIIATGTNLAIQRPLTISTTSVHSLLPSDLTKLPWSTMLTHLQKPVVVAGSGKTAMDTIVFLARQHPHVLPRLKCVTGRGTWFFNRNTCTPFDEQGQPKQDVPWMLDCMLEALELYDGVNRDEVLRELAEKNWIHAPLEDPQAFLLAVCSEEEMSTVRSALTPTEEHVYKAYFEDVVERGGDTSMRLRSLDGEKFEVALEPGSVVINCTGHKPLTKWSPILSDDGLVLSTQSVFGLSGPSAHLLTHAWYRNKLENVWRDLPRVVGSKCMSHWAFQKMFVLSACLYHFINDVLPDMAPLTMALNHDFSQAHAMGKRMQVLYTKMFDIIPERYFDPNPNL